MKSNRPRVAFIDDEPNVLDALKRITRKTGFDCRFYSAAHRFFQTYEATQADIVVSDIKMPDMDGVELMNRIATLNPLCVIIALTGCDDYETLLRSVNNARVWKYVTKPWSNADIVDLLVEAASYQRKIIDASKTSLVQKTTPSSNVALDLIPGCIGQSEIMRYTFELFHQAFTRGKDILISGNLGTGKRTVANALARHYRLEHQVVVCSSTTEKTWNEITQDKDNVLILENLNEWSKDQQLLLFNQLSRQASSRDTCNQIIATVSCDQTDPTTRKHHVIDALYLRLGQQIIHMPGLRNREKDSLLFAEHQLRHVQQGRHSLVGLSASAKVAVQEYHWPGELIELQSTIRRALTNCNGTMINAHHLGLETQYPQRHITLAPIDKIRLDPPYNSTITTLAEYERAAILNALALCDGDLHSAAANLDIDPDTLARKLLDWQRHAH